MVGKKKYPYTKKGKAAAKKAAKKKGMKVKAKLVKGLEKNKKDIKEHVELLSEEKDEGKIQTHKTRLQELLDARKKAEKLLEQEEEGGLDLGALTPDAGEEGAEGAPEGEEGAAPEGDEENKFEEDNLITPSYLEGDHIESRDGEFSFDTPDEAVAEPKKVVKKPSPPTKDADDGLGKIVDKWDD